MVLHKTVSSPDFPHVITSAKMLFPAPNPRLIPQHLRLEKKKFIVGIDNNVYPGHAFLERLFWYAADSSNGAFTTCAISIEKIYYSNVVVGCRRKIDFAKLFLLRHSLLAQRYRKQAHRSAVNVVLYCRLRHRKSLEVVSLARLLLLIVIFLITILFVLLCSSACPLLNSSLTVERNDSLVATDERKGADAA